MGILIVWYFTIFLLSKLREGGRIAKTHDRYEMSNSRGIIKRWVEMNEIDIHKVVCQLISKLIEIPTTI